MKTIPISLLKKKAKDIKKEKNIKHIESLDLVAKEEGFNCWNTLIDNSLLRMNYKTIEKLNVAKPKLAFFIFNMVESLKEIDFTFSQKDPLIISNYLSARFNSSYDTNKDSLDIAKLISIVYCKNTDFFDPEYFKNLLNFNFLIKEINKDYDFYKEIDFIKLFFYTKLDINFQKNFKIENNYFINNWFIFISGFLDTFEALIEIYQLKLLNSDFKSLSLKIKDINFLEVIINNEVLNSTKYFTDYLNNARQRMFQPTFNIFNSEFIKTHNLINFSNKNIKNSGEFVTNANQISVKLLKKIAKESLKDNTNNFKNSRDSLNFIANRYGYKNWKELIDYLELPLYIEEKNKFGEDFSRFNGFIEELKEIMESLNEAFNRKSYNALFFIYKRINVYSEVFKLDLNALKIITYIFINSSKKIDFDYLSKLFNIDYLLNVIKNNFYQDDFIKNSFYQEIFAELKDTNNNLDSFKKLTQDLKSIFNLINFDNKDNLIKKLSEEKVFNELINNELIIKYRGSFEFYTDYLKRDYEDKNILEINKNIAINYKKYY